VEAREQTNALLAFVCEGRSGVRPAGTVAVGRECDAFRRWIDALPAEGYEAVLQLRECGFTYDLAGLGAQLGRALRACPSQEPAKVGRRLLALLSRLEGAACFLLEETSGLLV
jgi:hypothetical protein